MTVLLTGAGGLLGRAFRDALPEQEVRCLGREHLDPLDIAGFEASLAADDFGLVINCAAHTDVEAAETDEAAATAANAILPGLLGAFCRRRGITLVHFSSTGCYGDWKTDPYKEDDPLRPTTAHHRSKAAGEAAVRDSGCEHLILRTGWLFGGSPEQPKNFVWRRLLEARQTKRMTSDATQTGNPTDVRNVARQALLLVRDRLGGTFNVTSQGSATRFAYVAHIVASAGLPCVVEPGPAFRRRAAVSPNEAAVNRRLDLLGLNDMPDWRDSLARYVAELTASPVWHARDEIDHDA